MLVRIRYRLRPAIAGATAMTTRAEIEAEEGAG